MPSLIRFLIVLVILGILGGAAMVYLALFVGPHTREMTVRIPEAPADAADSSSQHSHGAAGKGRGRRPPHRSLPRNDERGARRGAQYAGLLSPRPGGLRPLPGRSRRRFRARRRGGGARLSQRSRRARLCRDFGRAPAFGAEAVPPLPGQRGGARRRPHRHHRRAAPPGTAALGVERGRGHAPDRAGP